MREPAFWWREPGLAAGMLAPLATIYGALAARRIARPGKAAGAPVVCIGNPTVGGAGKTPLALVVARLLAAAGERPALLSRGYGGKLAGPLQVDPLRHRAPDVGDEPLLLASAAPIIIARDRVAGAVAALAAGAGVIVMDDGFQNPSLRKDFSILVVDARRGIGNGKVIPAGPLRAPLDVQLAGADALVVVGKSATPGLADILDRGIPVFRARLVPDPAGIAALGCGRVLAFAGIGDPEKFFTTLRDAGIAVAATRGFADHHRYTSAEAAALCEQADSEGLILVTTEKDAMRLRGDDKVAQLATHAHAFPVTLVLDEEAGFKTLLLEKVAQARRKLNPSV
jgi:tetraacyldisaccharide 4'-kinase